MRFRHAMIGAVALVAGVACGGGGGGSNLNAAASGSTTIPETTTTSPYVRPYDCLNAMRTADDVVKDQFDVADNGADLDRGLIDLINAIDRDAVRRASAQAKIDAATRKDATLRPRLLKKQAEFESSTHQCRIALGSRLLLTAPCQGVLAYARLAIAKGQELIASEDHLTDLRRQVAPAVQNGSYSTADNLIEQANDQVDTVDAHQQALSKSIGEYDNRLSYCTR